MNNPYLIGIIAWLLPGVGHLMQGRFVRGIIIGVVIWTMFIIAIFSGGAYYPGFDFKDGALLYLLNIFARFGNGLGALISFFLSASPPPNVAAWATFEYGGRFLEIAGLLNYMATMDAVDISFGRKK
jgi:TM2 domain-containing membrane protein YozV